MFHNLQIAIHGLSTPSGLMAFTMCLLFFTSCERKEDCAHVYFSTFAFKLSDKNGFNQIATWGAPYQSDSVFLVHADGSTPQDLEIGDDGIIWFVLPNIERLRFVEDTMVSLEMFLLLPDFQGNARQDTDTLRFTYQSRALCYDNFQVSFNDSVYHDGQYIDFIDIRKG
jgi:hypothetical protein